MSVIPLKTNFATVGIGQIYNLHFISNNFIKKRLHHEYECFLAGFLEFLKAVIFQNKIAASVS